MDRLNLLPTIANITSALSKGVQKDSHPQSGYKASKNSRRKESLSFPRELREEKDNIFLVLSFFSLVCLLACLLALGFSVFQDRFLCTQPRLLLNLHCLPQSPKCWDQRLRGVCLHCPVIPSLNHALTLKTHHK